MGGGSGPEYTIEGTISCSYCSFPIRLEGYVYSENNQPWTQGFLDIHKSTFRLDIRGRTGPIQSTMLRAYDLAGNTNTDGLTPLLQDQEVPVNAETGTQVHLDLDAGTVTVLE